MSAASTRTGVVEVPLPMPPVGETPVVPKPPSCGFAGVVAPVSRLRGQPLDVGIEVGIRPGDEKVARPGVEMAQEAIACPNIGVRKAENRDWVDENPLASAAISSFSLNAPGPDKTRSARRPVDFWKASSSSSSATVGKRKSPASPPPAGTRASVLG